MKRNIVMNVYKLDDDETKFLVFNYALQGTFNTMCTFANK